MPQAEENPWLWNSLGVAELNTGEYSAARTSFENAHKLAFNLTPEAWRKAYPGNNPNIYEEGFSKMKESILANLELVRARDIKKQANAKSYVEVAALLFREGMTL